MILKLNVEKDRVLSDKKWNEMKHTRTRTRTRCRQRRRRMVPVQKENKKNKNNPSSWNGTLCVVWLSVRIWIFQRILLHASKSKNKLTQTHSQRIRTFVCCQKEGGKTTVSKCCGKGMFISEVQATRTTATTKTKMTAMLTSHYYYTKKTKTSLCWLRSSRAANNSATAYLF